MKYFYEISILVATVLSSSGSTPGPGAVDSSVYAPLKEHILRHHNTDARPVLNWTIPVNVTIWFDLKSVDKIETTKQLLATRMFLVMMWTDEFVIWSPENFKNISRIVLPAKNIWVPDVTIYNKVKTQLRFDEVMDSVKVEILSTGRVTFRYPLTLTSSCELDLQAFPTDEQSCTIVVAMYTYDGNEVDVNPASNKVYTKFTTVSPEWKLVDTSVMKKVSAYIRGTEKFMWPELYAELKLKRKPWFYTVTLSIPCCLLGLLGLFGLLLPPDHGERITLQITVFLAVVLMLSVVNQYLPVQSLSIPMIQKFLQMLTYTTGFSVLACIITSSIFHRGLPAPLVTLCENYIPGVKKITKSQDAVNNLTDASAVGTGDQPIDLPIDSFIEERSSFRASSSHSDTESTKGTDDNEDTCQMHEACYQFQAEAEKLEDAISKLERSFGRLNTEFMKLSNNGEIQVGTEHQRKVWAKLSLYIDRIFFVVLFISFASVTIFYAQLMFYQ